MINLSTILAGNSLALNIGKTAFDPRDGVGKLTIGQAGIDELPKEQQHVYQVLGNGRQAQNLLQLAHADGAQVQRLGHGLGHGAALVHQTVEEDAV